jgi:hypothetical protein
MQGLFAPIVQPIIRGVFESKTLELLKDSTKRGRFKMTLEWTQIFMKTCLNWSYKATTTLARKLFQTWEQEGMAMACRVAYLVKVYNIPMCLIVNINQIGVHLVPTRGDWTWETRGAKHVEVLGIEDKRQITIVVSFSTERSLLLYKLCYKGQQIIHSHPMNHGRKKCSSIGFHLTYSSNH